MLLTGGMTRVPSVRQMISELSGRPIADDVSPDEGPLTLNGQDEVKPVPPTKAGDGQPAAPPSETMRKKNVRWRGAGLERDSSP